MTMRDVYKDIDYDKIREDLDPSEAGEEKERREKQEQQQEHKLYFPSYNSMDKKEYDKKKDYGVNLMVQQLQQERKEKLQRQKNIEIEKKRLREQSDLAQELKEQQQIQPQQTQQTQQRKQWPKWEVRTDESTQSPKPFSGGTWSKSEEKWMLEQKQRIIDKQKESDRKLAEWRDSLNN